MEPYHAILFRELDIAGVSYVLCGGLAIVLHGLHRFTADIDLAVALAAENLRRFIEVVTRLGYRPRAPVPADDLINPQNRRNWHKEKKATVFTFVDPNLPYRQIDVFLEDPLPFDDLQAQSTLQQGEGYTVRIASAEHLLRMKQKIQPPRPQDALDILMLEKKLLGEKKIP
jgi:Nucleotidyl transferase AbiEii toxin, Type IV TA system